jgi:hypothetical protein
MKIEKSMEVASKEQAIRDMVCPLSDVRLDVRCFERSRAIRFSHRTPRVVKKLVAVTDVEINRFVYLCWSELAEWMSYYLNPA